MCVDNVNARGGQNSASRIDHPRLERNSARWEDPYRRFSRQSNTTNRNGHTWSISVSYLKCLREKKLMTRTLCSICGDIEWVMRWSIDHCHLAWNDASTVDTPTININWPASNTQRQCWAYHWHICVIANHLIHFHLIRLLWTQLLFAHLIYKRKFLTKELTIFFLKQSSS